MPSARIRRLFIAGLVTALIVGSWEFIPQVRRVQADTVPPSSQPAESASSKKHLIPASRSQKRSALGNSEGSSGWWLGTAGIALALAICGGLSLASKRLNPQTGSSSLRVIGRTNLSPKHTVYLLKAGDRVLLVGTGPQGAPSLLGELDADDAEQPVAPNPRTHATRPVTIPSSVRTTGFDRRVGDDE